MKYLLALVMGVAAFVPVSALAQSSAQVSASPASCAELGGLAAYVERCGGTPPQVKSPGDAINDIADWRKAYIECVKKEVPQLDDKVSDASIIASGISAVCRSVKPSLHTVMRPSEADLMVERMKPYTISIVLQQRVAAQKHKK
jgi:hypothetical protein